MVQRELVELARNGDRFGWPVELERETAPLITITVTPLLPFDVGVC
jgi:hypothetical protein